MRKFAILFLFIFLIGLFLPVVSLADGTYQANSITVNFQGFVPCGKCLKLNRAVLAKKQDVEMCKAFRVAIGEPERISEGKLTYAKYLDCQFCHFFVMIKGIIDFVLGRIVPPLAVLMIVIGGIMFYFAGGNPALATRGKNLLKAVAIGLFLAYGAFMLVGTLLTILGVAETDLKDFLTDLKGGVFKIVCDITL
ncbi:MAG: pilin [Patescibacteria group bacterium]|nr:pilin [Patescibacteria group bacterium]